MKDIVLSIHPKWAKLIYEGKKTIEWRKTCPKAVGANMVFLYETAPVKKVTGCFVVKGIEGISLTDKDAKYLRKEYVEGKGCVPMEQLKSYQGKSDCIFGWVIGRVVRFTDGARDLDDFNIKRAPQSWQYVEA